MPRTKSPNDAQVTITFPTSWLERLDALARALVRKHPGLNVVRADAHRAALGVGLRELEAEYGLGPPAATPAKVPPGHVWDPSAKPKRKKSVGRE